MQSLCIICGSVYSDDTVDHFYFARPWYGTVCNSETISYDLLHTLARMATLFNICCCCYIASPLMLLVTNRNIPCCGWQRYATNCFIPCGDYTVLGDSRKNSCRFLFIIVFVSGYIYMCNFHVNPHWIFVSFFHFYLIWWGDKSAALITAIITSPQLFLGTYGFGTVCLSSVYRYVFLSVCLISCLCGVWFPSPVKTGTFLA